MSSAAAYDGKLKVLESQVQSILCDLQTVVDPLRRLECHTSAQEALKELQQIHQLLRTEVQLLEGSERDFYDKCEQEHSHAIAKLKRTLQLEKASDPGANGSHGNSVLAPALPTNGERNDVRRVAHNVAFVQNTTLGTLTLAERTLLGTENVSMNATTRLLAQTEQIRQVRDHVEALDSEAKRARKEVTEFIKQITADRIVICFYILIMLGIIMLSALLIMKKK
uniref:Vesicle transport v-SNARE N-terminal domain-containing protein n=1 Tax=Trypanosoma congolense (strain IL3000) TaxID=1068625 RepID=G0UQQ9_TRYCI|nr:conserved hypothetical protein [Trypanosoma congolense IL3000]